MAFQHMENNAQLCRDQQNPFLKDSKWGWKEWDKKAASLSSRNRWFIRSWEPEKKKILTIKNKILNKISKHLLRAQIYTAKVCRKSNVLRKSWQHRFNYTCQFSQSIISLLCMLWALKADIFIYLREIIWVCLTHMFHRKQKNISNKLCWVSQNTNQY